MMLISEREILARTIDHFWETYPPFWNEIRAHIRSVATEKYGISVEQFHVLRLIRRGITSIGELAEAKSISRPAVSQAVDVLVNQGLLTRCQAAHDRRFVTLALTPAGNDLLDAIFGDTRRWMAQRMDALSDEELTTLMEGMDALARTFAS